MPEFVEKVPAAVAIPPIVVAPSMKPIATLDAVLLKRISLSYALRITVSYVELIKAP
jgi:hypothetical protein